MTIKGWPRCGCCDRPIARLDARRLRKSTMILGECCGELCVLANIDHGDEREYDLSVTVFDQAAHMVAA